MCRTHSLWATRVMWVWGARFSLETQCRDSCKCHQEARWQICSMTPGQAQEGCLSSTSSRRGEAAQALACRNHSHTAANGGTMGQGAGLLLHSMRHAFLDANRHPVNRAERLGNHRISNIKKGPDGGRSSFRCWQHVSSLLLRLDSQTALILAFKLPGITQIKVIDGHSASIQPLMQLFWLKQLQE